MGSSSPGRRHITLRVRLRTPINSIPHPLTGLRGVNHGTFLHIAHEEGLIRNTSIHAGIRAPVANKHYDRRHDKSCGFEIVTAKSIDKIGVNGIVEKLKERTKGSRVYISVDIDVLDPAYAPGESENC